MDALTGTEIDALHEALDDESGAWATYDRVIADFGEAPPFSHIREAEARHIDALRNLFARYGLPLPKNPWPGRVPRYGSMQEARAAGAAAAGAIATGLVYAWYALLAELRRKGMRTGLLATLLYARAIKLPLLPLMAHYFSLRYTLALSAWVPGFAFLNGFLEFELALRKKEGEGG